MKKTLILALIFSLGLFIQQTFAEDAPKETETYQLDEEKALEYKAKEAETKLMETASETKEASAETEEQEVKAPEPKIITEKTKNGKIEKLLDNEGKVIAEKTIENDKIVKKVLYYYYPEGQLLRKVTAKGDDSGFYAEEYYPNGKVSSQATYLNEANKIGKEKRYDVNGVLRQEIPWILKKDDKNKITAAQETIRHGNLLTYYPEGQLAASFPVDAKGKTIFFDANGFPIKEIRDSQILNFPKELTEADCLGTSIHLDLEELVELYEDEGDISYNKCGFPYRENFVYEVIKKKGIKETKISYDETGMIRRITDYMNGKKDGLERKYDAAGNLTAEVNYKNGQKEGFATGYFPNKNVAFRKRYEKGKVVDKLTCYFPNGDIAAQFSYENGVKHGKAVVNSPIKKELMFNNGVLEGKAPQNEKRQMFSALSALAAPDVQCLNLDDRLSTLLADIKTKEKGVMGSFDIARPKICENDDNFVFEKNKLVCYDLMKRPLMSMPIVYKRGEYVTANVRTPTGLSLYDISYMEKNKQGWSKKYNERGEIISEIYFDNNKMDTARGYYPNGQIKELMILSPDSPHKMVARYDEKGHLMFSLTYKGEEKQEAYVNMPEKGKEITVRFYKNKPDSVRESNTKNPYNFMEYNLALGEYTVYTDNKLVKGGKLCNYQPQENIEVIKLKTEENDPKEQITSEVKENEKIETVASDEKDLHKASEIIAMLPEENLPEPPVMELENAPMVEDLEPITEEDIAAFERNAAKNNIVKNAILPSPEEKEQVKLAAKNIGPTTTPDIEDLAAVVQKEKVSDDVVYAVDNTKENTEKYFYPNGNLRKTVRTKGPRTEEVKEYSKNGLLLTDTVYKDDKIIIEKYFGSGEVRRKTEKSYDDNAVNAFMVRKDFFDNGHPRYEIERVPETMLFKEKIYHADGYAQYETEQTGALTFRTREYDKDGQVIKEINEPQNSSIRIDHSYQSLSDNHANGKLKTEVIYYTNGEISVKGYAADGTLTKFAYLAPDGKLYVKKPALKTIPRYRERYWVDYNNPKWIENQDKYSIKSIARLNLDITSKILAELGMDKPKVMDNLYQKY